MHVYIYSSFVSDAKFSKSISKIETRLTDLGLNGRIIRLGIIKSPHSMIEDEIKKGAKTIVAVGDDYLFNQIINSVAKISSSGVSKNIPVGFIPVGKKNNIISTYLGLKYEEASCDTISARRLQTFDLGQINETRFLTEAKIPTKNTTIEFDENYTIEINNPGFISIINFPTTTVLPKNIKANPRDNHLELFINTKKNINFLKTNSIDQSVFSFNKIKIFNPDESILADESIKVKCPAQIGVSKEKINLIIGKNIIF